MDFRRVLIVKVVAKFFSVVNLICLLNGFIRIPLFRCIIHRYDMFSNPPRSPGHLMVVEFCMEDGSVYQIPAYKAFPFEFPRSASLVMAALSSQRIGDLTHTLKDAHSRGWFGVYPVRSSLKFYRTKISSVGIRRIPFSQYQRVYRENNITDAT